MIKGRIREMVDKYESEFSPLKGKVSETLQISEYIDHTLLKPDATLRDIESLCAEAREYRFKAVCVNSCWTEDVARFLAGSSTKRAVVIGFPLGACSSEVKAFETRWALEHGADEFDMVMNIGALKGEDYDLVMKDIAEVVKSAKGNAVKVIIETVLLSAKEKIAACVISEAAGASFVKTSSGFAGGGATAGDVSLMRFVTSPHVKVKASGGIRDRETAISMIEAGAERIGTSSGTTIIAEE